MDTDGYYFASETPTSYVEKSVGEIPKKEWFGPGDKGEMLFDPSDDPYQIKTFSDKRRSLHQDRISDDQNFNPSLPAGQKRPETKGFDTSIPQKQKFIVREKSSQWMRLHATQIGLAGAFALLSGVLLYATNPPFSQKKSTDPMICEKQDPRKVIFISVLVLAVIFIAPDTLGLIFTLYNNGKKKNPTNVS